MIQRWAPIPLAFVAMAAVDGVAQESAPSKAPSPVALATLPAGVELHGTEYVDPNGLRRIDRSTLVFDEAVTRVAFVAFRGARTVACIGGELVGEFDFLEEPLVPPAPHPIRFRAGDRLNERREKWWLLADGKKSEANDWIGAIACSRDGAHVAWWAQPGATIEEDGSYKRGRQALFFDGKRVEQWPEAESFLPPLFSPDGSRVAVIVDANGWRIALAGKKVELLGDGKGLVRDIAWHPDGKSVAWCESSALGGRGQPFGGFSESVGAKFELVVGKRRLGARFDSCGAPLFSPDGRSIACKYLELERGADVPRGRLGIAVDEAARGAANFLAIDAMTWSADGKQLAAAVALPLDGASPEDRNAVRFVARAFDRTLVKGTWHLWRDGVVGEPFDALRHLAWSPDGKRLACAGQRAGKWHVVVDGAIASAIEEPFDELGPPHWSSAAATLVFGALRGRSITRQTLAIAPR